MRAASAVVTPVRAAIDLGLVDPLAQGLGTDAELPRHETHGTVALAVLGGGLGDQPDGSLFQLRGIPPLDRA
jgi:hypothetical protein